MALVVQQHPSNKRDRTEAAIGAGLGGVVVIPVGRNMGGTNGGYIGAAFWCGRWCGIRSKVGQDRAAENATKKTSL